MYNNKTITACGVVERKGKATIFTDDRFIKRF